MRYGYDKGSDALTTVNILAIQVFREVAAAGVAVGAPDADVTKQRSRASSLISAVNGRLRRGDGVYGLQIFEFRAVQLRGTLVRAAKNDNGHND